MPEKQPLNDVEREMMRYSTKATLLLTLFVAAAPQDVLVSLRDQVQDTLDNAMHLRDLLLETRSEHPDFTA